MKVLTVCRSLGSGGTERAAQNFSTTYQSMGHDVAALAFLAGGPRVRNLEEKNIRVIVGGHSLAAINRAVADAVKLEPDVVHIHRFGMAEEDTGYVLRSLKQRLGPNVRFLETNVFSKADYTSTATVIDVHLHLSKWCLWKWSSLTASMTPPPIGTIVPYIVDVGSFWHDREEGLSFRARMKIPKDAFVLGRIGQPIKWKWSSDIFQAFRFASQEIEAHLLLVGLPVELENDLSALPEVLRRRVHLVPFLSDDASLRQCYNAMDVFLHSSRIGESFGMVLAESLLCRTPVITRSTPFRDNTQLELIGDSGGGIVTDSTRSMTDAILNLARNSVDRARLGERGDFYIRQTFSSGAVSHMLDRLLHHLSRSQPRDELRAALEADPDLTSEVSFQELVGLIASSGVRVPKSTLFFLKTFHTPSLNRLGRNLKLWLRPDSETGKLPS